MKIGILTYHRAHNYGAILQAIALRFTLESMGHKVYYIDYWPSYHQEAYKQFSWNRFRKQKFGYLINRLSFWREIASRISHFEADIHSYILPFCMPFNSDIKYDLVIYGSDQIWRKQFATGVVNSVYFGHNNINAAKSITYAASMGELLNDNNTICKIKELLPKFDAISVREKDLQDYLYSIGIDTQLVLDPTLLVDRRKWDSILPVKSTIKPGYVLYYSLNSGAFDECAIKDFAKNHNLRFVEVRGSAGKDNENSISQCGPFEFLSLIKYADYVFSTSYHGLIFSIIFQKNFYTSFCSNAGRAESILKITGLEDRMLQPMLNKIPDLDAINYLSVESKLSRMKIFSLSFLQNSISHE